MGLTIHYSLSLAGNLSLKEVKAKLSELREACLKLPFQEVRPLISLSGVKANPDYPMNGPHRWALIQSCKHFSYHFDHSGQPVVGQSEQGTHTQFVPPSKVVFFSLWPGEGCEEANVGLCKYPKTVTVSNDRNETFRLKLGAEDVWAWSSFCKTCYSQDFLGCHLSVVAMLDEAKRLGFTVEVHDEGGYYQTRNVKALMGECDQSNAMIAAIGGALKDAGYDINAPITENPKFEQLEHQGQQNAEKIIELIRKTTA